MHYGLGFRWFLWIPGEWMVCSVWCVVLGGGGGAVLLRPFQLFLQPLRAFDGFGQYVDVITSIPSNPISRGIF